MNEIQMAIPYADLRELHERLSVEEARRVKLTATLCVAFERSKDKAAVVAQAKADPRFAPIAKGISVPSLYRK